MSKERVLWRRLPLAVVLAVCLLAAAACGRSESAQSGEQSPGTRVAVVTPYYANATTKLAVDLFEEKGTAKGWEVNVTDTAGDFDKLVGAIQNAVTQEVDVIILGMGDPSQVSKGLTAAQEADIPVFAIDSGAAPGIVANVTSDNTDLGTKSAEDLVDKIGERGSVVMFTHDPHPGVKARAEAAAEVFAKYPNIEVMEKKHINVPGPVDNARKVMQDMLTANPDDGAIQGVWAAWDEPAFGATQAIDDAGRGQITVVGVDGTDFAREQISQKGPFKSTVAQDWEGITDKTVELVEGQLNGEPPEREEYTLPGELITAEDV